jgi:hypothetical protein
VAGHLPICADKVAGPTSGEAHHGLQCAARSRCTAGPTVKESRYAEKPIRRCRRLGFDLGKARFTDARPTTRALSRSGRHFGLARLPIDVGQCPTKWLAGLVSRRAGTASGRDRLEL